MRSFTGFSRLLLAGIAAAAAALSVTAVAQAGPRPPMVPGEIQVPAGNKVFLVGHAVGVQIYSCNATAGGFGWVFVAPRANLYNDHGKLIFTHFAGPTWQAKDGSSVVGRAEAMVTVDRTAIPWVRLAAASTAAGPDGDRLVDTTYIQRISTTGGLAHPPPTAPRQRRAPSPRSPTPPTTTSGRRPAPDPTPVPAGAGPTRQPQPVTMGGTARPRSFTCHRPGNSDDG